MSYILQTFDLRKKYGSKTALNGLNLNVPTGSIYGFLGVNGSGKTTTISILGTFIKPTSGTFSIKGKLSILPQDARFYPGRKIGSQMKFFARLSGVEASEASKEVQRILQQVGLLEKINTAAEKISHGMYKRLGIAQALLGNPDILLLDEPTAGLDPENAYEIRNLIKSLGKEKTIVISSHNLAEISEMCENIGIIHEGKIRFEGKTKELTKDKTLEESFLEIIKKSRDEDKITSHAPHSALLAS